MATRSAHNKNSSAVKRILSEARELQNDDSTDYSAAPLEEDIFEWHCTIRGSPGTEFEGGLYHCRVLLPPEYPFKAPSLMVLTPNGRFELNKKICISFTSYHEELWQPAWGIRTAIVGLQGFFPLKGEAAVGVGAIEYPISERKRLAALSREWTCPHCNVPNIELLPDPPSTSSAPSSSQQAVLEAEQSAQGTQETLKLDVPVAPPHPSIASTSIPGSIPPLKESPPADQSTQSTVAPTSLLESGLAGLAPAPIPPVPVSTIITAPTIAPEVSMETGRVPTPAANPAPSVAVAPAQQNTAPRSRTSPILLDAAIAFFSLMIVVIAGKRFMTVWNVHTDGGY
ncbi:hypothetical protein FRC02_010880 [Tulasnella sp. 418]|nr:hypothetical protein FRC02_010880 [Tulasnella sp. 418]